MIYKKIFITVPIIFLFFSMACAPEKAPDLAKPGKAPAKEVVTAKAGWEGDWDRTLQAAQKEGRVVVYGGSTAAALKLNATRLIKEKFSLDLEVFTGRDAEIRAKIKAERDAGLYISDIYASGMAAIFDKLKPWGAVDSFEPLLILPEVLDLKAWFGGEMPQRDGEHKAFVWSGHPFPHIAVNSNVVPTGEIKSYFDLLNPKWKGKITINEPITGGGAGFYSFNTLLYNKIVDLDFFRQLVKQQQPIMLSDQHLQIAWLAQGKMPVAFWASTGRMEEYLKAGAPISYVFPKEGMQLSGGGAGLALMNKAPHSNAAKIFLNWFLSKEGQLLIQNATGKQSLRVDIPTDELGAGRARRPDYKYWPDPNDNEEFVLKEYPGNLERAKEIFGPLLGR